MTDKEILQKAIEKAGKNGFDLKKWRIFMHHGNDVIDMDLDHEVKAILLIGQTYALIFSHDFARAFWGNKKSKRMHFDDGSHYYKVIDEGWQYHLRDMVLEAEPLKYMERFL